MSNTDGVNLDRGFDPTFTGSRQERRYIRETLGEFYEDGWLNDVIYRVKGGKEATVYCLEAHPSTGLDIIAAKVFRPRMFRAMKNDAHYKLGRGLMDGEGKLILDGRSHRALRKKTKYGRSLDTTAWCVHEYQALVELHEAGAEVPRPLACSGSAILMEFVGDRDAAAPVLQRVTLDPDEARTLFDRLVRSIETFLACYRVHADLSAYNVLYWQGDVKIIDLPQAVDALRHPNAFGLFSRDIDRLCRYFENQGMETDPVGLAHDLWADWVGW